MIKIQLNCGIALGTFSVMLLHTAQEKYIKTELSENYQPVIFFEMILKNLNQLLLM